MSGLEFIIRLILATAAFVYLVIVWAWVPFITPEVNILDMASSVFFGSNAPGGWVRDLLLLSRGCLGLTVVLYILVPTLQFFVEFRAAMWNNTIAIVLGLGSIALFFAAIVVQQLYHL